MKTVRISLWIKQKFSKTSLDGKEAVAADTAGPQGDSGAWVGTAGLPENVRQAHLGTSSQRVGS